MKRIDVYYEGWGERWKLGTLAHHARIVMFEYSSEALTKKLELSPLVLHVREITSQVNENIQRLK